ncbi:MAG TPA: MOSC domain-containing protein [Sphingobium sp.]
MAGLGVEGDAHQGGRVQHRSRVAANPDQPNLRQVHLIQAELFAELRTKGHVVGPGDLGENITTSGIDLLALPTGTRLRIGDGVVLEMTGLRTRAARSRHFNLACWPPCWIAGRQARSSARLAS